MTNFTQQQVLSANNLIVRVPMTTLEKNGWEFRPDFEEDGREFSEGAFKKFMKSCDVDIYCRNGETTYVIVENGKEWGASPSGDDKLTAADVAKLINSGQAEIRNND